MDPFARDRQQLQALRRTAGSTLQVHEVMQKRPLLSVRAAARETGLSAPTVGAAFTRMTEVGMLREITGRKRDRLFAYDPYLALLARGTEPLR